jgi:hypothetical protein
MPKSSTHFAHPSFKGWIGVAQVDITPPVGIYSRLWGAATHDTAEGVHRQLKGTVMTIQADSNASPLVLVGIDLGWWRSVADERQVRDQLIEQLRLSEQNLMVCASHTHSGPSTSSEEADKPGGHLIKPYLEALSEKLMLAAHEAKDHAAEAIITWRYGRCSLAQNRDFPDPDADRILCGYYPDGPADDTLLVGRVSDLDRKPLATIINYACHPTTLAWENRLISPDYVGAMREIVEGHSQCPCLFLQGASGELAGRESHQGDTEVADKNGRELGWAVLSTLEGMLPSGYALEYAGMVESGAPIATWKRISHRPSSVLKAERIEVELELRDLSSLEQIEADLKACQDRTLTERLWRKRCLRRNLGQGNTSRQNVWIWQLGDAVLLGQANEAYACFQQQLRQRFSPAPIGVVGVVNGTCGYLPPAELYEKEIYQVWQTPFARGSLERMQQACEASIEQLLRDHSCFAQG